MGWPNILKIKKVACGLRCEIEEVEHVLCVVFVIGGDAQQPSFMYELCRSYQDKRARFT
jgi:hypothetical protein